LTLSCGSPFLSEGWRKAAGVGVVTIPMLGKELYLMVTSISIDNPMPSGMVQLDGTFLLCWCEGCEYAIKMDSSISHSKPTSAREKQFEDEETLL
jgi:hypothetical protein